jgi:hypothetical protein
MDITLITVDDIKEVTSIPKTIDYALLEPYITVAEGFFVYPVLGEALTSEIQAQLTGNTLSALNNILLLQYIRPLSAYASWHTYLPFGAYKSVQVGEVKQSSNKSESLSMEELAFKRQAIKDTISFYEKRLREYLEKNKFLYPLYRSSCTTSNYTGSIYLGKN